MTDILETIYKDTDCIKIPWVMMSSNGVQNDPSSILQSHTTRWNHDLRHPHPHRWLKGRCRYDTIEVKCICRCPIFPTLGLHHPNHVSDYNFICIETIDGSPSPLNPFYNNLRESCIERAVMLCYHYRVYSYESAARKLINNKLDGYKSSRKYEIAKQERLFDTIKDFKNEESLSKSDLKKIDGLVNRRIKEIAKKIRFKFNKDDEKRFFEFEENINYDIEIIEKKAELVDYVQKTFEVMGIIN